MALIKRGKVWWIDIRHEGRRVRKSTGTTNKLDAQHFHDKIKAELWKEKQLDIKPQYTWIDAVLRWVKESQHKRSLVTDKIHLKWADTYLRHLSLSEIDRDCIERLAQLKEATGVKAASVNRLLEVIRAILRKAVSDWGWLEKAPVIRMRQEENHRIRWLTHQEANKLLNELPQHLRDMAEFTLATGLREANVVGLQWDDVDLIRKHAWIHPDQAKTNKAIAVPLNSNAVEVIRRQLGKHREYIFTYNGNPVTRCNNHAWRKALDRAEIRNFRWHDLRHTWASWHVQSGTSLQELQALGGWSSFSMVLRYAHLSGEHLRAAAERIMDTKKSQSHLSVIEKRL